MQRRWLVNRTNAEFVSYLSRASSVSPVFAQILISRGIRTAAEVQDFLRPRLSGLSDPYDLPGMRAAVERIRLARDRGERVLVHGDYDADGLTATAIVVSALTTAGLDAVYFIPSRTMDGYGFNSPGIAAARDAGARLIVTVDCGIGSFAAADEAAALGIDLIITDHHEPDRCDAAEAPTADDAVPSCAPACRMPRALAVVNPKCSPEAASMTILSGAGLAFKLAHAMALHNDLRFSQDDLLQLLDLAALGTVADVVPLTGENRIITREALRYLQDGSRRGVRALKQVAGLEGRTVRTGTLAYSLVPRINAAGRVAEARDVVRLLLADSAPEADELAAWLDRMNSERQRIEEAVFLEALGRLEGRERDRIIVLGDTAWHQGVLGIVAAKLAEARHQPAFIFTIKDGIAKGSARSIPAFDICGGLAQCRDLLLSFGGHRQAAGVKLREAELPAFEQRMQEIMGRDTDQQDREPVLEIDAPVKLSDVNSGLLKELEMLEPFGHGNPEPVLGAKGLSAIGPRVVGTRHLKLKMKSGPSVLDAIGFDMGGLVDDLSPMVSYDAAFTPAYNEWNGARYLQLVLKGLRPSL